MGNVVVVSSGKWVVVVGSGKWVVVVGSGVVVVEGSGMVDSGSLVAAE